MCPSQPLTGLRSTVSLTLLTLLMAGLAPATAGAQEGLDELIPRIDSVFATWDQTRSPGCALGIVQDGELVLTRGYGMANLDYGIPISSSSVFYLASVSKQFTSAAVILAAQEGFLSLDDDIRQHFPEIPDYGKTVTVRHMIHHTSGLRDYLTLMDLAGMRFEDVHSNEEIVALIARQEELNFDPGDQYLYSNSGYFLLAELIGRATGMSLREFTDSRIFQPLGMTDTHFHDEANEIVPNRTISYAPDGEGGFRISYLANFDKVGSGGLYSTVEDLFRWDQNSYDPKVGGDAFLETMHTQGILNSGDTLVYAAGLNVTEHRGLRVVNHGGSMMGFKTNLLRFPDLETSIICLCNLGPINPAALSRRVAYLLVEDRMDPLPEVEETEAAREEEEEARPEWTPYRDALESYAGTYYSRELDVEYELAVVNGEFRLRVKNQEERVLTPTEPFVFRAGSLALEFQVGELDSFTVQAGRVRNLRFVRRLGVPSACPGVFPPLASCPLRSPMLVPGNPGHGASPPPANRLGPGALQRPEAYDPPASIASRARK